MLMPDGGKCRCWTECRDCYNTRIGYTGCRCPGCDPYNRQVPQFGNLALRAKTPFEYARSLGIIYRQKHLCIGDARSNVRGDLVYAYREGAPSEN